MTPAKRKKTSLNESEKPKFTKTDSQLSLNVSKSPKLLRKSSRLDDLPQSLSRQNSAILIDSQLDQPPTRRRKKSEALILNPDAFFVESNIKSNHPKALEAKTNIPKKKSGKKRVSIKKKISASSSKLSPSPRSLEIFKEEVFLGNNFKKNFGSKA